MFMTWIPKFDKLLLVTVIITYISVNLRLVTFEDKSLIACCMLSCAPFLRSTFTENNATNRNSKGNSNQKLPLKVVDFRKH